MNITSQKTFLENIFQYNHYVNVKLFDAIKNHQTILPEKVIALFSHIQNAHHIWIARIMNTTPVFEAFQIHPIQDIEKINEDNHLTVIQIINNESLSKVIQYRTSKGEIFSNNIQDILFHIVNHSTYHRAQIATLFRASGITPLVTDYISYKRQSI